MLELLNQILSLIQDILITPAIWLSPLKWIIVEPGECALRYTCGKPGQQLGVGVHLGTATQLLLKEHVHTRIAPTDAVTVLTRDGTPLKADAVVTYSIPHLANFFATAEDPDAHLAAVAEAAVRAAVSSRTFQEIVSNLSAIETELRKQIAEDVSGCGIKIKRARFQNLKQLPDYVRMAEKVLPVLDVRPPKRTP